MKNNLESAGDERKTPKGTPKGGIRTNSYWVTRLTEEEIDSETWQLEDYLEKIYKEISPKVKSLVSFVENILGFQVNKKGLKFDMSFYSGGMGIIDKIGISTYYSR